MHHQAHTKTVYRHSILHRGRVAKSLLTASEVLNHAVLQDCFNFNREWIAAKPRTTRQIRITLLPPFDMAGMSDSEIHQHLNESLLEAGFRPDGSLENPRWSLAMGPIDPEDDMDDLWNGDPTDDFNL